MLKNNVNKYRKQILEKLPPNIAVPLRAWKNFYWGERELRWLKYVCNSNLASIDIGANTGIYTYWLSRYSRECHAFEPNPNLFAKLERFALGRNIQAWPLALSNCTGEAILTMPLDKNTGLLKHGLASLCLKTEDNDNLVSFSVTQSPLDDLDLPHVGFIKIDVEGFEIPVLNGAIKRIKSDKPNVLIEAENRHCENAVSNVIDWFTAISYEGYFLTNGCWKSLADFDAGKHQNFDNSEQSKTSRIYVNNFLFLNQETVKVFRKNNFFKN